MLSIFSDYKAILGEGALWHPDRQSLFWVDIHSYKIFEKSLNGDSCSYESCWDLQHKPTSLALDLKSRNRLWVVTACGVLSLDLVSGRFELQLRLDLPRGLRTNDSGVGPDGHLWIGSMEDHPSGTHGAIYRVSPEGKIEIVLDGIGIPNTFCWSPDGNHFYLSDSLQQQMTVFEVHNGKLDQSQIFVDLSNTAATPDGGAIDLNGNLWNAQWDGFRIACYRPDGTLQTELPLDIPRPTSCCFGGPDNNLLFITSASEGLSDAELEQYSDSGKVIVIELPDTQGLPVPSFQLSKS